jgi:hypothetical protein
MLAAKKFTPSASRRCFAEASAIHVEVEKLSGAGRAAKRFLERRAAGIPMGGPDERKGGGKAA